MEIEEYEKAKPELKRLKSQIDATPIKRVTSIKKGESVTAESVEVSMWVGFEGWG